MIYLKYFDDLDISNHGWAFIEIDPKARVTTRQILVGDERIIASNVEDPEFGFVRGEGEIDIDIALNDEEVKAVEIFREEFDEVWEQNLEANKDSWIQVKRKYKIGNEVSGVIQIFYPQGAIVKLEENVLAVADREQAQKSLKAGFLVTKLKISGIVSGYDEENQWIVLDKPVVIDNYLES